MLRLGHGIWLGAFQISGIIPKIITGSAPSLAPINDGEQLSSAVTWGSYTSTVGTILISAQQMNINDTGWVAFAGATEPPAGATVQLREIITDSAGTPSRMFTSNMVVIGTVPGFFRYIPMGSDRYVTADGDTFMVRG
jgi:hypothetical protein